MAGIQTSSIKKLPEEREATEQKVATTYEKTIRTGGIRIPDREIMSFRKAFGLTGLEKSFDLPMLPS
ncbi:MAG: hypothetical protein M3Y08_02730, partial [Fibrobacterota bacterium]|nr:hypothetical protein [Fibrobacterota bacterium]